MVANDSPQTVRAPRAQDLDRLTEVEYAVQALAGSSQHVSQSVLNTILAELELPARLYSSVQDHLSVVGIKVTDDPTDDSDSEDDPGWDGDGLSAFFKRTNHQLLTTEQEIELAQRIEVGALAERALATAPPGPLDPASVRVSHPGIRAVRIIGSPP